MAEPFRLQVAIDEPTRERLRQVAGNGAASVGWILARLIEAGMTEKKRLVTGINRRLELALRGGLEEHDRAGVIPVPLAPKMGLELSDLATALDQTASGMAGLVVKIVLEDREWSLAIFSDALSDRNRAR